MATMGQRIKELREEHGYTQEQFAAVLGVDVSKSAIGMYELNKREPDNDKLEAIADFFNVDMDYLYGKSDFRNKQEWLKSQHTPSVSSLKKDEQLLISDFRLLNEIGKIKAIDYVSDLADNPKYRLSSEAQEEEAPYVPEVLAAHHKTGKLDDEDKEIINNAVQFVGELKKKSK